MRRKIIYSIAVIAFIICFYAAIMCACTGNKNKYDQTDFGLGVGKISKINYEGHTYLIRVDGYKGGMCHDENCACKKDTVTK